MTVDVICSVFNGARYLPDFLDSLQRQTHADWRLWVRDDGSSDDTSDIVRRRARSDPRITLLDDDTARRGVAGSFGWLLERMPEDSAYVMCADQDDVWLDHKIERTFAVMRATESETPGSPSVPVLVHTDLIVVDAELRVVHPSFWAFAGIEPELATLRRLIVRNVTTGAATMLNRALRQLVGAMPPEAIFHDWWCACVAVALGRIVAVRDATALYRQHDGNVVGASGWSVSLRELPQAIVTGMGGAAQFRRGIEQTAAQAGAFLDRYNDRLTAADRRFLRAYSQIPRRGFLRRKIDLFRLRRLPEHGLLRSLGVLLRG